MIYSTREYIDCGLKVDRIMILNHWIREMLRQGMVVARQATATYIEVVVQ